MHFHVCFAIIYCSTFSWLLEYSWGVKSSILLLFSFFLWVSYRFLEFRKYFIFLSGLPLATLFLVLLVYLLYLDSKSWSYKMCIFISPSPTWNKLYQFHRFFFHVLAVKNQSIFDCWPICIFNMAKLWFLLESAKEWVAQTQKSMMSFFHLLPILCFLLYERFCDKKESNFSLYC